MNADLNARNSLLSHLSHTLTPASETMADTPLAPPAIPDHELIRRIGRGSYGEVWLARNVLGAWRAVKIVHRAAFDHDRPYEREFAGIRCFEPVSRAHPSQLNVLHAGRNDAAGHFYYVMELADPAEASLQPPASGYSPRTLRSDLFHRGRLPFDECLQIGLALSTALDHLHRHGLVHRDIKPSNIIFVNGIPKLADIGLVAQAEATLSLVGTQGYLPPEGPGTGPADIFSLGKVLYEMATGRDRQEYPELPTNLLQQPAAERAQLAELNEIIVRACQADPRQRYQTAAELHADLALLQSGRSVSRMRTVERRLRFLVRAGALVTGIALLAGAAFLYQQHQTREARRLAQSNFELAVQKSQLAEESRQRLVQMQAANGIRAMDSGDPATAALWFSEVLQLSQGDAAAEQRQRFRLGTLFRYLPLPAAVYELDQTPRSAWLTPDGKRVVARDTSLGDGLQTKKVKVWETDSGRLLHSATLSNIWGHFVSPGGRWSIVSEEKRKRLWDIPAGVPVESPLEFEGTGGMSAWNPDESTLATVAYQGREVRILAIPSGRSLTPPLLHSNSVLFLAFDREGRQLVTGTEVPGQPSRDPSGQARVWDAGAGAPVTGWLECRQAVNFATFSPDGRALAVLGNQVVSPTSAMVRNEVRVVDLPSGRLRCPPLAHKNSVLHAAFSPDGRFLATAVADQTAIIWDAHSGEPVHPPLKHSGIVLKVCFSPDGAWLATGDKTEVRIWDVQSGVLVAPALKHGAEMVSVEFSPDGRHLITAAVTGPVRVWNLAGTEPALPPFQNPDGLVIVSATFARDGGRVVTTGYVGDMQVWQTADGRKSGRAMQPAREDRNQYPLLGNQATWSADGKWLAAPSGESTVRIWDARTGEPLPILLRHSNLIISAEFSPLTNHLATASGDSTARVWDAATGQPVTPPLKHSNQVDRVRFSPDGRRVATASLDRTARVWDAATGAPLTPPLPHLAAVCEVAFSPDGSRVATADGDGSAMIWDAATGQRLVGPMRHLNTVGTVCFSPSGQYLLTASMDHTARVWDALTGRPVTPPLRHDGWVETAAFSPGGTQVVTGSYDGTARVWDALTGEPLSAPFKHRTAILHASFSPDGRQVATASLFGAAQLWDIPAWEGEADEAAALAQLLAGGKVGPSGTVEPLDPPQLAAAWQRVAPRLRAQAHISSAERERWPRRRLAVSEQARDWFAAEYHARRLLDLRPGDPVARADYARILDHRPPPRAPATRPELIDLTIYYNASLALNNWKAEIGDHLAGLPRGVQAFAGTDFDVRGLILVTGEAQEFAGQAYPKRVNGIRVGLKLARLQFLHSVQESERPEDGIRIGHYLIHFANDRREELPIIYGRDARDWHEYPADPLVGVSGAVIAWQGSNPAAVVEGRRCIRLFKRTWDNPSPEAEVASLDFVAEHSQAHPFLVAITAE